MISFWRSFLSFSAGSGKVFGHKRVKSPYNCFIYLFTQPQVANQQQQQKKAAIQMVGVIEIFNVTPG